MILQDLAWHGYDHGCDIKSWTNGHGLEDQDDDLGIDGWLW